MKYFHAASLEVLRDCLAQKLMTETLKKRDYFDRHIKRTHNHNSKRNIKGLGSALSIEKDASTNILITLISREKIPLG